MRINLLGLSALLVLLFSAWAPPALAIFGCVKTGEVCTDGPSTRYIQPANCASCAPMAVTRSCWNYKADWTCYTGEQTSSCSTADLSGCYLGGTDCLAYSGTTCVQWSAHYICSGSTATTCQSAAPLPSDAQCDTSNVTTTCNQTYLGACVDQTTQQACYAGNPAQCNTDTHCGLASTSCASADGALCGIQTQNYTCSNASTSCVKTAMVSNCQGQLTYGLDNGQGGIASNGFNKAVSALSMLNAIEKSANTTQPTIFAGVSSTCVRGEGLQNLLYSNCCALDLKDAGDRWFNKCDQNELQLAAARRANLTHPLGSYCYQKDPLGLICRKQAQVDCVFDNMLAKTVNEQGRQQLANMAAASSAGAQTVPAVTFPYYAGSADKYGTWALVGNVSGSSVYAFEWPAYCADPASASQTLLNDPLALQCESSVQAYFASCGGGACTANSLPADPRSGSDTWDIQTVNPLISQSTSVSKYAAVTGSCDVASGQCSYAVAAWPQGAGGQALIRSDLTFPLYAGGYSQSQSFQITQYIVVPHSLLEPVTQATLPATVSIDLSSDGGTTFASYDLPTNIAAPGVSLGATPVTLYGSCDAASQKCAYRMTLPVAVTAIPWGTAQAPNCRGFNLDELAVLDFNKMDLSAWLATVKTNAPDIGGMQAKASADTQAFMNTYQSGGVAAPMGGSSIQSLTVQPTQALGTPVTATAVSNWPMMYPDPAANLDPVAAVTFDWGDGTTSSGVKGSGGYTSAHTYAVPASGYVVYHITATYMAQSGSHSATIDATSYSTPNPTGGIGTNEGGGGLAPAPTSSYTPASTPSGYSTSGVPGVPAP